MSFAEFTVAADGSNVAIDIGELVEIRDLSKQPSRHLGKWGRVRLTFKSGKRRIHTYISEDYQTVMTRVRAATIPAAGCACKTGPATGQIPLVQR